MGDYDKSNLGASSYQQPEDYREKIPKYIQKKAAGSILSDKDYMHIAIKNDGSYSTRFTRTLKILFTRDKKIRGEWVEKGKADYRSAVLKRGMSSSSSPVLSETKTESTINNIANSTLHLDETLNQDTQIPPFSVTDTRQQEISEELINKNFLQLHKTTLEKIIPGIKLESLTKQQESALASLLNQIGSERSLAEKTLLIKVAKQLIQHSGGAPSSQKEVDDILKAYQQLSAFRKEAGDLIFNASNWKKELGLGRSVDQAFIQGLKRHLSQEGGWGHCLKQLEAYPVRDREKVNNLILNHLVKGAKEGSFDPTGEKEQALLSILSACEEFPGFLDALANELEIRNQDEAEQFTAAFIGIPNQIQQLTVEIQNTHRREGAERFKMQFHPSLSPLIDQYILHYFPDRPPQSSEFPDPNTLPQNLLAFEMEQSTSIFNNDAIPEKDLANFKQAFTPFLPQPGNTVKAEHIQDLSQLAKMGNQLAKTHGYKNKEVVSGCVNYLQNLQQRNQLLKPPENKEALNPFLLSKLSEKEGWQNELEETAQTPGLFSFIDDTSSKLLQDLSEKLIASMESKGIKPVNQQEVNELKALVEIGVELHQDTGYPLEAIVSGLTDYLSAARAEKLPLTAPHRGISSLNQEIISPYCFKHLSPLEGWENGLQNRVSTPFTKAFLDEMAKHPNLFPVNSAEAEALEKIVLLGAEIVEDPHNSYNHPDVAIGCVEYLENMRKERRSFTELSSFGGLSTTISPQDLYPLCFNGLVQNLLKDMPKKEDIVAFFQKHQPIHGTGIPITEEGKNRLEALLKQIGNKDFAQGEGIQHRAMVGKLPSILFDLNLTSIDDLNRASLPPERVSWLFDRIQEEQFLLPSIHEVLDVVNKEPVESSKTIAHTIVSTLMGNPRKTESVNKNLDQIVEDIAKKDPKSTVASLKKQLNKLMNQLQLTESAQISISISTKSIITILKSELNAIQEPAKNNQSIKDLLNVVQTELEKNETIKSLMLLEKDRTQKQRLNQIQSEVSIRTGISFEDKKALKKAQKDDPQIKSLMEEYKEITREVKGREKEIKKIQEKAKEELNIASYSLYKMFMEEIRPNALRTDLTDQESDKLEALIKQLGQEIPQETSSSKKGALSFGRKKSSGPTIEECLPQLLERLNGPRGINVANLHEYGVMGEVIKNGVDTLEAIQKARNEGTYGNEDELKEVARQLKFLEGKLFSKVVGAILFTPMGVEKGIRVGIKLGTTLQIRKTEKELKQAESQGNQEDLAQKLRLDQIQAEVSMRTGISFEDEKTLEKAQKDYPQIKPLIEEYKEINREIKGREEKIESLTTKLNTLRLIKDNRKEIAKVVTPIALTLLSNHKVHEHRDTIKMLRQLLEDPNKKLDQTEKDALAAQFASSAAVLVNEVETYYPNLIEDLMGAIFDLPNQGKVTPEAKTNVYKAPTVELSETQKNNISSAQLSFKKQLLEEFPLKEEVKQESFWGAFTNAIGATNYEQNQKTRELATHLGRELSSHPFFANHFNPDQLNELIRLVKEGVAAQESSGLPPSVIAAACRIYIEQELATQGKLDVPFFGTTVQERIINNVFQASVEQSVRQSGHPQKEDPYLAQAVAHLVNQVVAPSQEPLNEVGQANITALVTILLNPKFANGKPIDLPVVVKQFKYLFPNEFNSIASLNERPIPPETLATMLAKSQKLVERGINLGLLQEGLTQNPEEAVVIVATPLIDALATNQQEAGVAKRQLGELAKEFGQIGQISLLKNKMNNYLEKFGILKAVQIDVSISTRQATSRLDNEKEKLKAFMESEKRLPTTEEAEEMGVLVPRLVSFIKEIAVVKDIQNGKIPNDLKEGDRQLQLLNGLNSLNTPKVKMALQAATFFGITKSLPTLINLFKGSIPQILKWVIESQIEKINARDPLTEEDQATLDFLNILLEKDNLEKLTNVALPLINGLLGRHDLTRHDGLVTQLLKIADPDNKNGVDEVELMMAFLNTADVVLDEVNTQYAEAVPDLLNAVKALQFLAL